MEEVEVWKTIPQTEGEIQVSSLGQLRRLISHGNPLTIPRIIKPTRMMRGYVGVEFKIDGKRRLLALQHCLLSAFIALPATDRHYAIFKDGNKRNFSLENLMWATAKERNDLRRIHGKYGERPHRMVEGEIQYQCIYCEEWKTREGFYKLKGSLSPLGNRTSACGISSDCKHCSNEHRSERRRAKARQTFAGREN